jgi:isovaleryl-CoA dehydrogenase
MKLKAEKKGDRYVLNGFQDVDHQRRRRRHAGGLRQDRPEAGAKGMTAFIVEKGFKGFSHGSHLDKLGMRGSNTYPLVLR